MNSTLVLVVKRIDERKVREFKAEAIRRGLTLSKAIEEAIDLWLPSKNTYVYGEVEVNNKVCSSIKKDLKNMRANTLL